MGVQAKDLLTKRTRLHLSVKAYVGGEDWSLIFQLENGPKQYGIWEQCLRREEVLTCTWGKSEELWPRDSWPLLNHADGPAQEKQGSTWKKETQRFYMFMPIVFSDIKAYSGWLYMFNEDNFESIPELSFNYFFLAWYFTKCLFREASPFLVVKDIFVQFLQLPVPAWLNLVSGPTW